MKNLTVTFHEEIENMTVPGTFVTKAPKNTYTFNADGVFKSTIDASPNGTAGESAEGVVDGVKPEIQLLPRPKKDDSDGIRVKIELERFVNPVMVEKFGASPQHFVNVYIECNGELLEITHTFKMVTEAKKVKAQLIDAFYDNDYPTADLTYDE